MTRPLLPPRGVFVPASMIYDKNIPPVVRDTWMQLRGLAWGKPETPELSLDQLETITGKSKSTIYDHMRILRSRGALRWRPAGSTALIISFDENCDLSENLEKPDHHLNIQNPPHKPIDNSKDGAFRNSGKLESKPKRKSAGDPKTSHPAIRAIFRTCGHNPKKDEYDLFIEILGESPDLEKMQACWDAWIRVIPGVKKQFSPYTYGWLTDWYRKGIPSKYLTDDQRPKSKIEPDELIPVPEKPTYQPGTPDFFLEQAKDQILSTGIIGRFDFDKYVADLWYDKSSSNGTWYLVISGGNSVAVQWCTQRLKKTLEQVLAGIVGHPVPIEFLEAA